MFLSSDLVCAYTAAAHLIVRNGDKSIAGREWVGLRTSASFTVKLGGGWFFP